LKHENVNHTNMYYINHYVCVWVSVRARTRVTHMKFLILY